MFDITKIVDALESCESKEVLTTQELVALIAKNQNTVDSCVAYMQTHGKQLLELIHAAKKLTDKLEVIRNNSQYHHVWKTYYLHAGAYCGPTYTEELRELKKVLGEVDG